MASTIVSDVDAAGQSPQRQEVAQAATLDEYVGSLAAIKVEIQMARTRAVLAVNGELTALYWRIGRMIVDLQTAQGPRSRVVERLSVDLRRDFPSMKGLGRANLNYMRAFALAWSYDDPSFQQLVGKIPWGHNVVLLDRLAGDVERRWYAAKAVEYGWSRAVLTHQIMSKLHLRSGAALSNFADVFPPAESELLQQVTKDPYNFEFLGIDEAARELDLERALIAHVQRFLIELGQGFAFVGRQHAIVVSGQDYFIDLLFFHIPTKRYVVLELKREAFTPEAIGKLNFYVNVIDDQLRVAGENATIGLLLCAHRDEKVVRYALSGVKTPLAVAGYTLGEMPADAQIALPAEAGLIHTVEEAIDEYTNRPGS